MKNIKYGIALWIALVCAMSFIACKDSSAYLETGSNDETSITDITNPAIKSYGRISVHIAGQEARTVLPLTVFDKYAYALCALAVDSSGNVYAAGFQYGDSYYTYGMGVSAQGSDYVENLVLVKYKN